MKRLACSEHFISIFSNFCDGSGGGAAGFGFHPVNRRGVTERAGSGHPTLTVVPGEGQSDGEPRNQD